MRFASQHSPDARQIRGPVEVEPLSQLGRRDARFAQRANGLPIDALAAPINGAKHLRDESPRADEVIATVNGGAEHDVMFA